VSVGVSGFEVGSHIYRNYNEATLLEAVSDIKGVGGWETLCEASRKYNIKITWET